MYCIDLLSYLGAKLLSVKNKIQNDGYNKYLIRNSYITHITEHI